jgi:uncharacterized protein DUF4389
VSTVSYPARVRGELQPRLSRWLWLVKWLLAIPHFLILALLWIAFFGVSVIAFFAILFTGRYPRSLFDFNVGVLRWTWRVAFYTYGALGTDRYPPFTLAPDPSYPATLEVAYPERLSRGLVLVKWWLLAIPHYLVVALFLGSSGWAFSHSGWGFAASVGLIALLVFFAAVVLLFRGQYPSSIFDLVLGLDRWVIRVAAYVGLMTDRYPPFRLDQGAEEPIAAGVTAREQLALESEALARTAAPAAVAVSTASRWTAGRVVLVVLGSIAALVGAGLLAAGIAAIVIDQTQRDKQGFLVSPSETFRSPGYAVVSQSVHMDFAGQEWVARRILGTVKLESESVRPVFLGIGREADVNSYLGHVSRSVVKEINHRPRYDQKPGGAPSGPPAQQHFWVASASGTGKRALTWDPKSGHWLAVLMNANGSAGVEADARIGAKLDPLFGVGIGVAVAGGLLVLLGALGIALGASRAARGGAEPTPA